MQTERKIGLGAPWHFGPQWFRFQMNDIFREFFNTVMLVFILSSSNSLLSIDPFRSHMNSCMIRCRFLRFLSYNIYS